MEVLKSRTYIDMKCRDDVRKLEDDLQKSDINDVRPHNGVKWWDDEPKTEIPTKLYDVAKSNDDANTTRWCILGATVQIKVQPTMLRPMMMIDEDDGRNRKIWLWLYFIYFLLGISLVF